LTCSQHCLFFCFEQFNSLEDEESAGHFIFREKIDFE
jgi:hypothetical protein